MLDEQILQCYRLLEVEPGASLDATRQAYRELLKVWHPDRFPNDLKIQQRANRKTAQINDAYAKINAFLSGASTQSQARAQASAHEEAIRRAREEAEKRAREEAARQARAAAEARAREEAEKRARDEAARQARSAAEARANEACEQARRAEEQARERYNPERLVWIKPGTFMMGSPLSELDRVADEGPQTRVMISRGFWMSKYETTQEEYQSVMGSNPSHFKGELRRPVEQVSWTDAIEYCGKLTDRERRAGRLPAGFEYRLPTEAEWEYSCRAGTTTRFSYGDDPTYSQLGNYAWCDLNSGGMTHRVGVKKPNAWGLYDMHGNVTEWCLDWYGDYPGRSVIDPRGPNAGSECVLRGGQWYGFGRDCRSASRSSGWPRGSNRNLGFRAVLAWPL